MNEIQTTDQASEDTTRTAYPSNEEVMGALRKRLMRDVQHDDASNLLTIATALKTVSEVYP